MALLITVLILLVVSLLGASIVRLGGVDYTLSGNYRASATAFHLAESGMETTAADLRADFYADPANNWLRDWINTGSGAATVVTPFPDPTSTTINGHALSAAAVSPDPYAGSPYNVGAPSTLGAGTYRRVVWLPPTVTTIDGRQTVQFRVRSTGTDTTQTTPAESIIDGVVNVALDLSIGRSAGMFLGTGAGGDALRGDDVRIAGSVVVLGDGRTRFRLRGSSKIVNSYGGIGASNGLGSLAGKLPMLDAVDFNGETIDTIHAVVRARGTRFQMDRSTTIGEADVAGDTDKETVDALYTDDMPPRNRDVYADSVGAYDLGDEVAFPSLLSPYTDTNGTSYASFSDFLNANSYTPGIGGDLVIDGTTAGFSYIDPLGKGSLTWNAATGVLTIDGVVKINGQAALGKKGKRGTGDPSIIDAIEYAGSGVLWVTDTIEIATDVYPQGRYLEDGPDPDGLVDANLTLVASKDIMVQSGATSPNVRVVASLFAEERIRVRERANIAGSITTDVFDSSGNPVNIWHVPMLAAVSTLGSPVSAGNLDLTVAVRDWFQRR